MTAWYDCTGFQRDCLHAIAAHESDNTTPYGLELKAWLDRRYEAPIDHNRLYQNLSRLADNGLVRRDPTDGRKTHYSLTDAGRQALATHARLLAGNYDDSWLSTHQRADAVTRS